MRAPLAEAADRHELYQRAVQDAPSEVDFLRRAWQETYGRRAAPRHLREDFCGTALLCAEWIRRSKQATAEGYDLDPEVLQWGRKRNLEPLGSRATRVQLFQRDVRARGAQPADVRCAANFSYQIFHTRQELRHYFRRVRSGLSEKGIFVLDMFGGTEAIETLEEEREGDGFTYVWRQLEYWPGTARILCTISFRFADGSELRDCFRYDWRLWTMPELKELLSESGFSQVHSYFEQFDEDGDGTGSFVRDERGTACEGWLAYLVAVP